MMEENRNPSLPPMPDETESSDAVRILVVDDEESMRELLSDILKDEGYDVDKAPNGDNALEKLKLASFDLMITDLKMPGMDGIQFIKKTRQVNPECIIIVITAYASVETAVKSMKLGAYDYITKPFNADQIRIVIEKALDKKQLEREAREKEFYKELSRTDALTDLYNRRHILELLEIEIIRSGRYNRPFSLIMLDIDHFKIYNDLNGHPMGDGALNKVARIIQHSIRSCDIAARYGGEEFLVIVPETDKKEASVIGERIRKLTEKAKFEHEEKQPGNKFTLSLGLAEFPVDGRDGYELIEKADRALYHAKNSGRNRLAVFNPGEMNR